LIVPILGCKLPGIGRIKTKMSENKTITGNEKVVSFDKIIREKELRAPIFSNGLYHWVMFVISFYTRIHEKLKIDFETFIILQVVVSHSLYQINKEGNKSYRELEEEITSVIHKKISFKNKLTFASISEVLKLPRETVRRKILGLCKNNILLFDDNGIKLGSGYKTIYKEFVNETTLEISSLIKKWKRSGALETLLKLEKNL
jgi:hypothetical protein